MQMTESEEQAKILLMRVKEESENAGLKLYIKTKIVASGPITSWQIEGGKAESVADFIFPGSKITADNDHSHEVKKTLAPWKKSCEKARQHISCKTNFFGTRSIRIRVCI